MSRSPSSMSEISYAINTPGVSPIIVESLRDSGVSSSSSIATGSLRIDPLSNITAKKANEITGSTIASIRYMR